MKSIHFIIIKHTRLDFKGSEKLVADFISKRLAHFSFDNVIYITRDKLADKVTEIAGNDKYLVVLDILNPIVDIDLIIEMIRSLQATEAKYAVSDGAIPGTQVDYVISPNVRTLPSTDSKEKVVVRWFSQDKHNNQFNLYKYKRLKMFLFLLDNLPSFHSLSIERFIDKTSEDKIYNKLAAFSEEVEVFTYENCPHCQGRIIPLKMKMSQPFCGYLPVNRPLYHECEKCKLIVMSPYVDQNKTFKIYDSFDKQDFVSTLNNPYCEGAARCDFSDFSDKLPDQPRTLDLGGGMGLFSKYLKTTYEDWDVTHSDFEIKRNINLENLGIATRALNFIEEPIGENCYDLITAWEVLEHIPYEKLESTLANIYNALPIGGIFMFSTPDFDSPLCKSNDFFAVCPPFHYLVFGTKWLRNYLEGSVWEIHSTRFCSDFLDDSDMWYDYANNTAPSFQLRATATVLKELLSKPENKQLLLDKEMGTEVIFTLVKK